MANTLKNSLLGGVFVSHGLPGLQEDGIARSLLGGDHGGSFSDLVVEEQIKRRRKLAANAVTFIDVDPREEHLVEEPLHGFGRAAVGRITVACQRKRRLEIGLGIGVTLVCRGEPFLELGELGLDAVLLGLQQLERDGIGVVSLQEPAWWSVGLAGLAVPGLKASHRDFAPACLTTTMLLLKGAFRCPVT